MQRTHNNISKFSQIRMWTSSGLGQSVIREKKNKTQNKCSYALRKTTRLNFIGAINEVKKIKSAENKLKWYMIIPVKINDIHVNQPARLVRDLLKTTLHTTQMVDLKKHKNPNIFTICVVWSVGS